MERRVSNNHAHHQVALTDLEVYVSPHIIHLLYDVSKMLTSEEDTQVWQVSVGLKKGSDIWGY